MISKGNYSDGALAAAIAESHSWRAVLRELDLPANSAGAARSARSRADRLDLDYSHFTGQRHWSDAALIQAVAGAHTWAAVAAALDVKGGSSHPTLKRHARRLGLDTSHISSPPPRPKARWDLCPKPAYLRHAGPMLAGAWFALCGHEVSWPLEPYRYDLLVCSEGRIERVQIKTTTRRLGGSWIVDLAPAGKETVYDPDDIDSFFIIDAELRCYFVPIEAVAGLRTITLGAYTDYLLPHLLTGLGRTG